MSSPNTIPCVPEDEYNLYPSALPRMAPRQPAPCTRVSIMGVVGSDGGVEPVSARHTLKIGELGLSIQRDELEESAGQVYEEGTPRVLHGLYPTPEWQGFKEHDRQETPSALVKLGRALGILPSKDPNEEPTGEIVEEGTPPPMGPRGHLPPHVKIMGLNPTPTWQGFVEKDPLERPTAIEKRALGWGSGQGLNERPASAFLPRRTLGWGSGQGANELPAGALVAPRGSWANPLTPLGCAPQMQPRGRSLGAWYDPSGSTPTWYAPVFPSGPFTSARVPFSTVPSAYSVPASSSTGTSADPLTYLYDVVSNVYEAYKAVIQMHNDFLGFWYDFQNAVGQLSNYLSNSGQALQSVHDDLLAAINAAESTLHGDLTNLQSLFTQLPALLTTAFNNEWGSGFQAIQVSLSNAEASLSSIASAVASVQSSLSSGLPQIVSAANAINDNVITVSSYANAIQQGQQAVTQAAQAEIQVLQSMLSSVQAMQTDISTIAAALGPLATAASAYDSFEARLKALESDMAKAGGSGTPSPPPSGGGGYSNPIISPPLRGNRPLVGFRARPGVALGEAVYVVRRRPA